MNTTDTVSLLREALYLMLQQFTGTPSTLADTEARAKAHKALAATAAPVAAVQPAGEAPTGFAAVPLIPNAKMRRVMEAEGWAWEDLLSAAEAITEEQYDKIATSPEAIVLGAIPAASAPVQPEARDSSCRMTGGICACRSGGSFGGCAKERNGCCTSESAQPEAKGEAVLNEGSLQHIIANAYLNHTGDRMAYGVMNALVKAVLVALAEPEPVDDVRYFTHFSDGTMLESAPVPAVPADKGELPPLPEADWVLAGSANNRDAYTADEMHAYGQACILAERSRQAAIAQPSGAAGGLAVPDAQPVEGYKTDFNKGWSQGFNACRDKVLAANLGNCALTCTTLDTCRNYGCAAPQPPSTGIVGDTQ